MSTPEPYAFASVLSVMVTAPSRLLLVPPTVSLNASDESLTSLAAAPEPVIPLWVSVKPWTSEPWMPACCELVICIQLNDGACVEFSEMPSPVLLAMVPPVPDEALPVTVRCPDEPVVSSLMPFTAPLEETLRNVTLLAPIVVLAMVSAVPVVLVSVFAAPVTSIVPLLVAENAALVPDDRVTPPVRWIVAPLLFVMATPGPDVSLMAPDRVTPPPVMLTIDTVAPVALATVPE